jgi:hypothetical protein
MLTVAIANKLAFRHVKNHVPEPEHKPFVSCGKLGEATAQTYSEPRP